MLSSALVEPLIQNVDGTNVCLDFQIPFELNIDMASKHIGQWLTNDFNSSDFSVVGIFSSVEFTALLCRYVDPTLSRNLRLLVYLTTYLFVVDDPLPSTDVMRANMITLRDHVGNSVLGMVESLLKPAHLEASNSEKLQAVFLLILGTIVAVRYTLLDVGQVSYTLNFLSVSQDVTNC